MALGIGCLHFSFFLGGSSRSSSSIVWTLTGLGVAVVILVEEAEPRVRLEIVMDSKV